MAKTKYPDVTAGQTEAIINIVGGWDRFLKVLRGELVLTVVEKVKTLLSLLGTITVPATNQFVARDNFKLGKNGVGWMNDNFKAWFLGKTEGPAEETTLRYSRLTESSLDAPILKELGDRAETTLANLFHLLSLQAKGGNGVLLVNGYANIFYVRDASGELRTVIAGWYASYGDWSVDAFEVTCQVRWDDGDQVFSRNPA